MAERSEELRAEIEETRERMGETVDALAYKADVPTRTKEWIGEKKDAVTSAVSGTKDSVTGKVSDVTPDGQEVKVRARRMRRTAERNPLGLAIGGAAAGFLAGLLVPSTRVEDEKIGPMADELKSTASEAGREAMERGKQVVQEAGETAMETARERGRQESEEMSASLQDKARDVAGTGAEGGSEGVSAPGSVTGPPTTPPVTTPGSQTGGSRSSS